MEILLLEIGDIGRGRVADMDLAGGVFAKVVSNPVQFGLAFNLHLRGDAGVAANVSSDEVEVDGIKPDLESTDLFIVLFPFSTVTENIDSPYSRIPKLSSSLGLFESTSLFFSSSSMQMCMILLSDLVPKTQKSPRYGPKCAAKNQGSPLFI